MATFVPRRERPVDSSNRYPRGPAYACSTEKEYRAAENTYRLAYQAHSQTHDGPYATSTISLFNNWIIALIKLRRQDQAEAHCRSKLQSMEASGMQESSCFVYVQCNLATSLYLSGHLLAAEDLFDSIRVRQDVVSDDLAIGFFEVLSLVRLMNEDCLVFRECSAKANGLVPVEDYTMILDGKLPKKSSWRSSVDSLRRITSMGHVFGQRGSKEHSDDPEGPRALLKRAFRLNQTLLRSKTPRPGNLSASYLPVADSDRSSQHNKQAVVDHSHAPLPSPSELPLTSTFLQSALVTAETGFASPPNFADASESSDEAGHEAAAVLPSSWPTNNINTQPATITVEAKPRSQPCSTDGSDSSDEIDLDSDAGLVLAGSVLPHRLLAEHTLHPPSTWRVSFDASPGGAHRSLQTTTSSQDADSEDMSLLAVNTWAADRVTGIERQVNALLDGGSCRNLASLGFARAINARISPADDVKLENPDGSILKHMGRIKVNISFKGPAGTRIERIRCLVVRNLKTALLIGRRIIKKLDLEQASKAVFGPILMNPRSKKEKRDNETNSKAIAAVRVEDNHRQAVARKAERAMTATPSTPAADPTPAKPKTSPPERVESPIGGSDTTAASPRSSMTFHRRSNTSSTATSSPSLRTNSSHSNRGNPLASSAANAVRSTTSVVTPGLQRKSSRHRRSDAQDLSN